MAKQISASPSNKKISELYNRVKDKSLILQPDFQRKFVWNSSHKESFIETILMGLPFPEIYIAQSGVDLEKIETQEVIVDGQQRLSTIMQYIDEEQNSVIFGKKVKKFVKLEDTERKDFLNYNVVIRDLGDVSEEQIKEIFKRINKTKYSLEQIEIHNAIYDGEFISAAKKVIKKIDKSHIPIFSESELSRMSDLQFVLLIMSTFENGGYFPFDKEIEKYIIKYNDSYPSVSNKIELLAAIFHLIKLLDLEDDSIWYRKSNFFTLVCEFIFVDPKVNLDRDKLRGSLSKLEKNILKNKNEDRKVNEYAAYYGHMYTGTNSRQARVNRAEIFNKHVIAPLLA